MIYVQLYLKYMLGFYGKQIQMHNSLQIDMLMLFIAFFT
jgi:hypothetical protein